jgi:glucose 1-dehydrogenase
MKLKGKTAVVTGGSRGIGRAIALACAREGAAVVVNYVAAASAAEQVVAAIRAAGGRAVAVRGDVQDLSQHDRILSPAVEQFGALDILVNNAGIARRQPFLEATPPAWEEIIGVNLKGVYFLSQAAARLMIPRGGGKMINISSVHDTHPMPGNSIYCIAKAGLVMLTRSLAVELAAHGIQVNCVSPGAVATDENRDRLADPAYREKVLSKIPCRRIGAVEDVTGAVILLASSESDYITGVTLYVDGGMLLS